MVVYEKNIEIYRIGSLIRVASTLTNENLISETLLSSAPKNFTVSLGRDEKT